MAEIIKVPRLSKQSDVTLRHSEIKIGDEIKEGDFIAELDNDKLTFDLESYVSGKVLYSTIRNGERYKVGDLLLIVGEESENIESILGNYQNDKNESNQGRVTLGNTVFFLNNEEYSIIELVELKDRLTKMLNLSKGSSNDKILKAIEKLNNKKRRWF